MQTDIEPAGGKIESDRRRGLACEFLLRRGRIFSLQNFHGRFSLRPGDLADQLHQWPAQAFKRRADSLGCFARFEFIQQSIVRIAAVTDALRFLLFQYQCLGEPRLEARIIGSLAGLAPYLLRARPCWSVLRRVRWVICRERS